ncbi:response regulator [Methylobacterium sp. J-078]|uniref:hybrid sensor histidine kinase/response regulator n=1 Tax=Methylobacterium sp. J-078 TaxID=2836657 RepID=UPI001FBB53B8|nr:response regulator [Methylobacterium sp. J-078]MCJ2045222.1 response regulator [Methylobacterium sp. J-078]
MDIRQLLLAAFEVEHREHIDAIRDALAGGTAESGPDWNDVFRRAHSLKGASRAVDLPAVEAVAHRLEALFERVAAQDAGLSRTDTAAVHLALDRIEAYVAGLTDGAGPDMPGDALAALDRTLDPAAAPEPPAAPTPAPPEPVLPEKPSLARPVPVDQPAEAPQASAAQAPQAGAVEIPQAGPAEGPQGLLRVPAEAIEALTRATHDLASALGGETQVAEGLGRLARRAADLARLAEGLRGGAAARRRSGSAKASTPVSTPASTERTETRSDAEWRSLEAGLLALSRDAAEVSRLRGAVAASVEGAMARVSGEAERLALVPAETAFGGFPRALRDLAREAGREIAVTARGLELPVDRAMLQVLKDPVLHALRNALSHGADAPEARRDQGKPSALAIGLDVSVQGARLLIRIHDDGRGPDLAAIAETARRRGLLAPGAEPEREALLALVFEPGFSTAAAVDTLSGRGMGLSVVADAARRLGGSVRLAARAPFGTELAMSLPLSAAQRAMLLVEAGGVTYALPSAAAERLLSLSPGDLTPAMGRLVTRLRIEGADATLPVLDLRSLLGLAGATEPELGGTRPAILLRGAGRRCVLTVDGLSDVRTLRVLPAPPIGADPRLVSGTVILAGDRPALVLDADGLVARAGETGRGAAPEPTGPRGTIAQAPRSTILVVDDSITTRTLEKGILEAAGYRVVVCVDGQDALDRLRAGIEPVDLVVADVEMPRLDGFGLVKALRADEAFARLPIILMTSRGDAEDVARGLELGADAYLTKQTFDQRQLLDTIRQLL